jgi:hypothetical protein
MSTCLRCLTLIQKQVSKNTLFFAVDIAFSVLMFQISTHILLLEIETLSSYIFTKK